MNCFSARPLAPSTFCLIRTPSLVFLTDPFRLPVAAREAFAPPPRGWSSAWSTPCPGRKRRCCLRSRDHPQRRRRPREKEGSLRAIVPNHNFGAGVLRRTVTPGADDHVRLPVRAPSSVSSQQEGKKVPVAFYLIVISSVCIPAVPYNIISKTIIMAECDIRRY